MKATFIGSGWSRSLIPDKGPVRDFIGRMLAMYGRVIHPWRNDSVALLHPGRAGSTVLGRMVGESPEIHWDSETLWRRLDVDSDQDDMLHQSRSRENPELEIRRRFFRAGRGRFGCEFKPIQLRYFGIESPDAAIAFLKKIGVSHIIVLRRRNFLRQLISTERGRREGYHQQQGDKAKKAKGLELDLDRVAYFRREEPIESALEGLERTDQWLTTLGESANLTITYEDHVLHDPMVGYEMICKTIDLPSVQPTIDLQRTNPGRIDDLVAQPAALRERLSGTRWAWMLESE